MNKPHTNWDRLTRDETLKEHQKSLRARDAEIEQYQQALREYQHRLDVALAVERKRPTIRAIAPLKGGANEATAIAVGSDWHVEERVRPENVNFLNEFNLGIAEKRIERFFQSIVRLTEIERAGTRIPQLVLALLGDLITGYIHEELMETNSLSPVRTLIWLRDRIISGITHLIDKGGFERIVVVCSNGNHGRTTKKMRHATSSDNSFEWLLYQMLAKHLPQVEWVIAEAYHTYLQVYGWTFRFHHGDGINYQGGIGGLTIPLEKAIAAWNKAKVADLDIFGNWHTQMQNPKWVSNGSLIGHNAYSIAIKAPYEPPQQTYFLVDSKRGRTGTWPIHLGDARPAKA